MDIESVLSRFDGVRQSKENQWQAKCPAHDDNSPSLGITIMDGNKIVLNCFAGCFKEDIVGAVGLQMHNLFLDEGYGKACCQKIPKRDMGVNRDELDRLVLDIAAARLRRGDELSISDLARVRMAKKRLSDG